MFVLLHIHRLQTQNISRDFSRACCINQTERFTHEGGAGREALGLEESENHATADDELVALAHEGLNDTNLRGHLGATDDGSEGALGVGDSAVKVVELLLKKEAGHGGLEELGHTSGGGVGAVGSAESVVDVPAIRHILVSVIC